MHFVKWIKKGLVFVFCWTPLSGTWGWWVPLPMGIILHFINMMSTRFLYLKVTFIILLAIKKYFGRDILWLHEYSIQIPKFIISLSTYFSFLPELFIMMMDCKCWFFSFSSFVFSNILVGILQASFSTSLFSYLHQSKFMDFYYK